MKVSLNNPAGHGQVGKVEDKPISSGTVMRWLLACSMFGLIGLGLVAGSAKLLDPQVMPFKVVRIEGEFKYLNRHELEQAIGAEISGGFFSVDVAALRTRALQLPWVAKVAVRRVWPDTLLIQVVEQVPLARWGDKLLVNQNAGLFQPQEGEVPSGFPWLDGPVGTEAEVVANYRSAISILDRLGLRVVRLQLDPRRAWTIEFADGSGIRLGSQDIQQRLARFARLYPQLKAAGLGQPKQVDLRYTNGLVVHWERDGINGQAAKSVGKSTTNKGFG
ncbi:Cell division protein FtsQ [hydrothermal vent metagenome]|uniref:Cell division protein FtsQ n=1 Tax=hydrothermal vent metagenome TaxID=652676 RepID=A0A3B1BBI9_9ZZZZ